MPLRVDILTNRLARLLRSDGELLSALRRQRSLATVHETFSLAELDDVARAIAARGTDAVILAGGDGSYMAGVTSLLRAFGGDLPKIAFAPGGTVSTVGRNWSGGFSRRGYVGRLVDAVAHGTARATLRPTLAVCDSKGGDRTGFIFGTGLVAGFFDEYYGAGGALGYAHAAKIVGRIFAGSVVGAELARRVLSPLPCALTIDGEAQAHAAWSLVVASVVRDLGLHMLVTYRAGERTDRFHAIASALGPAKLGPQLPLVLAGRRLLGSGVDTLAATLGVRFGPGPSAYVLDGELLRADEVTVSSGRVLTVLSF